MLTDRGSGLHSGSGVGYTHPLDTLPYPLDTLTPRRDLVPGIPNPQKGHGTRDTLPPGKDTGPEIPCPPFEQTDASENITFSLWSVNIPVFLVARCFVSITPIATTHRRPPRRRAPIMIRGVWAACKYGKRVRCQHPGQRKMTL